MKICVACDKAFDSKQWRCPFCGYEPATTADYISFAPELSARYQPVDASSSKQLVAQAAFWYRPRTRLLTWAMRTYFPAAKTFFEIGCGTGSVLSGIKSAFPEVTVSGSEILTERLQLASALLPQVDLFQMDARRIPFSEEFDVMGAFDVLEHIEEDELALSQMHRAVRKGGGIILTVPHHRFLWSAWDDFSCHARRYETKELMGKVKRAGFEVLRVTSFVSLLMPLIVLTRLKERFLKPSVNPALTFSVHPALGRIFEAILDFERLMIRAGMSLPFGASLLLIARRK